MNDREKSPDSLVEELRLLRRRLTDAEGLHRRSEDALHKSENLFHSFVDGILDAVLILDWEGTILFANKAAAVLVGVPEPEAGLGRNAAEFVHPDYLEAAFRDLMLVKEGKGGFFSEYIMRTSPGEEKWVEGLGTKIAFGSGTANLVTLRDITLRKRSELELRDSEEHFQAIVQNVAEGIVTIDETGSIRLFNKAAERIFGYEAAEVVGRNVNILMPDEYRERHDLYLRLYLKEPERRGLGVGREVPGRRKDGSAITLDVSLSEVSLSRGRNFVGVIRDVTETRRTEQRLRDLTAMQRAILNSAGYSIISTDAQGTIKSFNAAAERLLGWKAEEVIGRKTPELIHDAEEVARRAEELSRELGRRIAPGFDVFVAKARQGAEEEREWTYVRKDGGRIPVSLSVTALRDEQGAVTGFVGIGRDITLRRRAEEDRRKLYRAVEQSPATVVVTDDKGAIEYVNPKFTQITGYSAQEAIGQNPRILKSGEMPPEGYRNLWETITAGNEWRGVFHNKKKNGQLYWESVSISPVKDESGQITHFVAVKEDITEMRETQEELAKLSLVASKTDNAVIITDRQGRIEWVNDGFTRITGYTMAEVMGKKPGSILRGPLTDTQTECRIRESLASRKSFTEEILNYGKDGRPYWLSMTITPVLDEEGEVLRFVAIESDITGRKRTEEELQKAKLEADAANHAKSEFLASMSHEIRTPMNAILGMADLLWESDLTAEQKQYVGVFRSAGENLLNLINDILDLSKVESGRMSLEAAAFNPADVLNEACGIMSPRAHKKDLQLSCRIDSGVPARLVGDPVRLRQILLNLIGNAIKFTEAGSVLVEAGPALAGLPEPPAPEDAFFLLEFKVKDTGVGIPPDKMDAIFERFTQADSSTTRKYGGSGLGLTISRQLVELMGGRIGVESEPGKGSTFIFTARFGRAPESAEIEPAKKTETPQPDRAIRILLVEDTEDNRLLVQAYVRQTPFALDAAENGKIALAKYTADPRGYDLVLMDMQMPVMDGYTAAREIRKWETQTGGRRVPIVALTAHALKEDIQKSIDAGCDDHLTKPIRKTILLEMIRRHAPAERSNGGKNGGTR